MGLCANLCPIGWPNPVALLGLLFGEERPGIGELPFLSTFCVLSLSSPGVQMKVASPVITPCS